MKNECRWCEDALGGEDARVNRAVDFLNRLSPWNLWENWEEPEENRRLSPKARDAVTIIQEPLPCQRKDAVEDLSMMKLAFLIVLTFLVSAILTFTICELAS